jgi:hypothetical protein
MKESVGNNVQLDLRLGFTIIDALVKAEMRPLPGLISKEPSVNHEKYTKAAR